MLNEKERRLLEALNKELACVTMLKECDKLIKEVNSFCDRFKDFDRDKNKFVKN